MIFYFSCTGNTRWVASEISKAIGERTVAIDMTAADAMYDAEHLPLTSEESIGFCFPVHGWRPPLVLREWFRRAVLPCSRGRYVWALCTMGDTVGEAMNLFASDLSALGIELDSRFSIQMPETYVGLPGMNTDSIESEQRKISAARKQLERISLEIRDRSKGKVEVYEGHWPRVNSRFIGSIFVKHLLSDRPFGVDLEKCTSCGRCSRVCPVGNIVLDDSKHPVWQHSGRCMSCFACYHYCHERAIEYGWRTRSKGQYYFGKNKEIITE